MIPQLLLEQIALGEKDAKDFYEKYGKDEIENALKELKKMNEEILKDYPLQKMQENFDCKFSEEMRFRNKFGMTDKVEMTRKVGITRKVSLNYVFGMACAAVFAIAFCIPIVKNSMKTNQQDQNITRVKGNVINHHQLRVYKKIGENIVALRNGEKVEENDVLQITYLPGPEKYGVIFSVDGNSNITRHFPEGSWQAKELKTTGEEIPLEFSYVLDDAPKYECFIFVASKNPFNLENIESIDKDLFNIEYLNKGLYLSEESSGTMFVLNK